MNLSSPSRACRGMTLTEIMIVTTIFGFVIGGALPFFIMNLKSQFVGQEKLLINGDIRKVTNQMVENAREANSFVIYQSFCTQNRFDGTSESRDANGNGSVTVADRVQHGASGDFVVLVFYADPYFDSRLYDGDATNNPALGNGTVSRVVGYWTAPNRRFSGETALYSFDSDKDKPSGATSWTAPWGQTFPVTLSTTVTMESILPAATSTNAVASDYSILINNLNGLSSQYNFYNYQNKSIVMRAKILHGSTAKRVTNTYNFTITPRG